ncbi:histidine triad (HIT) family protein, partial [Phenoliferia sp. Uapishka_3]
MSLTTDPKCIFCKIVAGDIPSFKLHETDKTLAFLDVGPISKGHALIIPKHHGAKLHDLPDEALVELLPIVKKIAVAVGCENYNVLQNNGRIAHQQVDVSSSLQLIPKPSESDEEGLVIGWPTKPGDMAALKAYAEEIKGKL